MKNVSSIVGEWPSLNEFVCLLLLLLSFFCITGISTKSRPLASQPEL